jgi:ABC-type phosphate/phosphonate transport system substrate-binding protein
MRGRPVALERFVSFPWYDGPELRPAVDALWASLRTYFIAAGLPAVPVALDRDRPYGVDPEGECLFTQTCSYTLFTTARGHFTVLAAPGYDAPGCEDTYHCSFVVVRDTSYLERIEHLRGTTFAINEMNSNSGMNLPRALFARGHLDGVFFREVVVSGSHLRSADLVSRGRIDAAAIDCVTFALLQRYHPAAVRRLRIIAQTPATHTPPFVTSRRTKPAEVEALRSALRAFFTDPATRPLREAVLLAGFDFYDEAAYDPVMQLERDAIRRGYPVLR